MYAVESRAGGTKATLMLALMKVKSNKWAALLVVDGQKKKNKAKQRFMGERKMILNRILFWIHGSAIESRMANLQKWHTR